MRNPVSIFIFALAVSAGCSTQSQVLCTANINLAPGEVIHDVEFDPYHNCYIVVGNFTSINGINRKNIAFLNAHDLTVSTASYLAPFSNIDGEIRTVELTKTSSGSVDTYHLYIGGNFGVITSGSVNNRKGIAKFTGTKTWVLPLPTYTNFALSSWNADLDMTTNLTGFDADGVDDIIITNDTVIFSGRFFAVNNSSTYDLRDGIAAYTLNGSLLAYPALASTGTYFSSRYFTLEKIGANLYAGGYVDGGFAYDGVLLKLSNTGNIIPAFNFNNSNLRAVLNFYPLDDSLIIVVDDRNALNNQGDNMVVYRQSDGSEKLDHALAPQSGLIGGVTNHVSLGQYKDFIYCSTIHIGNSVVSYENIPGTTPVPGINWNANATNTLTTSLFSQVHAEGSYLFVSAPNLTTLSGASHLRFGAYCLEPHDAQFFTSSDSTICPGDIVTYAIPAVNFADGYKWEYTGMGADLTGDSNQDLIPFEQDGATTLSVEYLPNFTPGQLQVTPYRWCNGGTVKLYSSTISTNIISNPLPHINAGADTTLTCAIDTILLHGYSDSAVISHEWLDDALPGVLSQDTLVHQPGNYIFKVTNSIGCSNYDTVIVSLNTTAPVALPPAGVYDLTCAEPVKNFLGSSPTANTTSEWFDPAAGTYSPNPITVSLPGSYQYIVTDTINGCTKDTSIFVELNTPQPNITVVGYPGYSPASPLDTLTCNTPVLNLTCSSDTANTTATWTNADTSATLGDNINVSAGGNYYILVTNNSNGCTNFTGVNISTFFSPPAVHVGPGGLLNCSADSVVLSGSSTTSTATVEWTGPAIPPSLNPVTIYTAGTYYLTATLPGNGCTAIDSIIVLQDNSINVSAGNDVLACDQDFVNVAVSYDGDIGGTSYLWNTGTTGATEMYTAGNWPYAAVEVFGDNGCYGTDTVYIGLPPTPVINFEGYKPCDNSPSGQIVATPVSGLAPFQYSIDEGVSYQISPVFTGLSIGTYPVWVKDSLSCDYQFQAIIDQSSALPDPEFLFSTYNYANDTVVIIDVSNPPADSVFWQFSSGVVVLDNGASGPSILLADTGTFEVIMTAHFGNCVVTESKVIYANPYDSSAANFYNANGIKSIELYPNPTSGDFTVDVEFFKSQRAALVVQDMVGYTYVYTEFDESFLIAESISLDAAVLDGTYVLKIVSEFDSASITFVLAR